LPGTVHVISNGGASPIYCAIQYFRQNSPQTASLIGGEPAGCSGGVQSRFEEGFIGINVADACNDALIEQDRLQRSPRRSEPLVPVSGVQMERFRTQVCLLEKSAQGRGFNDRGLAEATHIPKAELPAAIEIEDQMSMPGNRCGRGENPQLTRHTKMHEQADRRV
jgi:hypothetical protein